LRAPSSGQNSHFLNFRPKKIPFPARQAASIDSNAISPTVFERTRFRRTPRFFADYREKNGKFDFAPPRPLDALPLSSLK
jgi:hypothetical protein